MADWTNLPNAAVGVGGLPSGTTVTALRDNPIALAEGKPGAPRILLPALEEIAAGTTIRSRIDAEVSAVGEITGHGFAFIQRGSVRVTFEHGTNAGSILNVGNAELVRIRNGSETVLATHDNTISYVSRTADVSIIPGDFVFVRNGFSPSVTYYLRNVRFQTSGANLWPASDRVPLENTYA